MSGLPKGWVATLLEDCIEILDSKRIPVNNKDRKTRIEGKDEANLFPYYGATGQVGFIDNFIFDEELVALGEDGVAFFDTLKSKAYMLKGKTWVNNHAHVLRGAWGEVDNRYLCYFLNQTDYRGFVNGATRLKLTQANMRKMPFKLSPKNEQTRIANKLDQLLAKVDATQQRLNKIPTLLKRFRQSILAAATSGQLTEEWRGGDGQPEPPIDLNNIEKSWLEKHEKEGTKYQPPKIESSIEEFEVPQSWVNTFLGKVFDVHVGATPSRKEHDYWNGNIPWVSSGEVAFCRITDTKEKISKAGLKKTSTKLHPKGTVMLAMIGQGKTRGQPAILDIEACHNQNTAALRVLPQYAVTEFLYFFLWKEYENTRKVGGGNNQKALNKTAVQSLPFLLPPLKEQQEIVRRVEELFALAERIEKQYQAAKTRVDKLTQSILAKAFRGELVPQDPNDEPAEQLLARIRADREADLANKIKPKRKAKTKRIRTPKKGGAMTKSRDDEEVRNKPYLADVLRIDGELKVDELFQKSKLSVNDFYKQLAWEVDNGYVKGSGNVLEVA